MRIDQPIVQCPRCYQTVTHRPLCQRFRSIIDAIRAVEPKLFFDLDLTRQHGCLSVSLDARGSSMHILDEMPANIPAMIRDMRSQARKRAKEEASFRRVERELDRE
jgi:hypothetical protein